MTSPPGDHETAFDWTKDSVNQRHVQHLQNVTTESFVQRYKARSHLLLELESGQHVLDVGCGLGDDVVALAGQVGADGKVVGIDHSDTMIQQARDRHAAKELSIEFKLNDATQMTFADNIFDAARTDRVLQHIPNVQVALKEIVRVLKPGGRVVLSETDWDSLTLDVTDREVFRKIKAYHADHNIQNGWMGRHLFGFLVELEMQDITATSDTGVYTDYAFMERWGVWHDAVQAAQDAGVISEQEAHSHLQDMEERAQAGKHFFALTIFIVTATNPT
jgi:ubiquinone/menaquinone biosynthesis C-methylase UbiE